MIEAKESRIIFTFGLKINHKLLIKTNESLSLTTNNAETIFDSTSTLYNYNKLNLDNKLEILLKSITLKKILMNIFVGLILFHFMINICE